MDILVDNLGQTTPKDDVIMITNDGTIIRIDSEDISTYSRVTKGVRLMRLPDGVKLVTVAKAEKEEDEENGIENTASETQETQNGQ